MIILDATTKSLQFKLGGAVATNQLPFSASYIDATGTATTPGENDNVSNNTTAVTIVAAPAASTNRLVKNITIQNADTATATVTVTYYNSSGPTSRNIIIVSLSSGDQLIYEDGNGWGVIDTNGNFKTVGSAAASNITGSTLASNVITSSITGFGGTSSGSGGTWYFGQSNPAAAANIKIYNNNTSTGTQSRIDLATGSTNAYTLLYQRDGSPSFVIQTGPGNTSGITIDGSAASSSSVLIKSGSGGITLNPSGGAVAASGTFNAASGTTTTAGGSTTGFIQMGTTSGLGIYFGSGAPTISAAQGSLYLRSDGVGGARIYVNNNGSTGWTAY